MINSASLIVCIDLPGDDLNTYRYSSGLHIRKNAVFFLHLQVLLWHKMLSQLFSLHLTTFQKIYLNS